MDVRNCRKCGRVFNYIAGPPFCQACREVYEAEFNRVKDYVRENPRAKIEEIAEACEVTSQQIIQWIRQERLSFSDDSPIGLSCEGCGAIIRSGRFCDKCKLNISRGFDVLRQNKTEQNSSNSGSTNNPRMRFLDN